MHVIQRKVGFKGLYIPVENVVVGGRRKLVDHWYIQKKAYLQKF